jgi:hypothetical protein
MRNLLVAVCVLVAASCGGGDKKPKEAKKAKPPTPALRAERLCEAGCARNLRCDEEEMKPCMHTCRLDRTGRMHVYRPRFVFAYADCLDKLPCDKDAGRCQAVAVATVMEEPEDEAEDKSDDKAKKGDGKKKDTKKKDAKKDKKKSKKKKDPEAEKKRKREAEAAVVARALYQRCHDRRIGCDATWDSRCTAVAALNDGGRERSRECLGLPCTQIRRCLQDAVSW